MSVGTRDGREGRQEVKGCRQKREKEKKWINLS